MNRQVAVEIRKPAAYSQDSDSLGHAAIRLMPDRETQPAEHATSLTNGHDFSQLPVTTAGSTEPLSACSMSPRRCPFGGACHTCPARVQAKLAISQPGDEYEQEADRVAGAVMRMPEPDKDEEERCRQPGCAQGLQRQATGAVAPGAVPPIVREVLRSPGQPLDAATRAFMEPRFGHDLSRVRVHTDAKAAESAQALNARAYTIGSEIAFGAGQYKPQTQQGRLLLAHEMTHVTRQDANHLYRWSATNHGEITQGVISSDFKEDFSWGAAEKIAQFSGEMDIRTCNFTWFLGAKTPIVAPAVKYLLDEKEAPNHGEANLYKYANRTSLNQNRMNEYKSKAIKRANNQGIDDQSLLELGYSLHVGQDRGAHEEGLPGAGHARRVDPEDPNKKWHPDDPSQNKKGHEVAKGNTVVILKTFKDGLNESAKASLKTATQSKSSAGLEVSSGIALTKGKPQFYAGLSGYALESGRVFGLWSPVLKAGYGFTAGKRLTVSLTEEVGLRLTRITPRIYVDVLAGGVVGYDFTDKRIMAGVSTTIQAHYTGKKVDLGIMLNDLYDFIGNRNVLVIGVSTRF